MINLLKRSSASRPYVLRIDSSARGEGSHSRELADTVEAVLTARFAIKRRDLAKNPAEFIQGETIEGFYTPSDAMTGRLKKATSLSDTLIDELMGADVLLLSVPMYNFGIPASLKAWVDQVVRINKTFSYDGGAFTGLVTGKRAVVTVSYGASGYIDGEFAAANFVEPYLGFLLQFLGYTNVNFFRVESTTGEESQLKGALARAKRDIETALG